MATELSRAMNALMVRDLSGRNPDQWVAITDLGNYISADENAKILELAGSLSETNAITKDMPGFIQKSTAISTREDSTYERLSNKIISNSMINDTDAINASITLYDSSEPAIPVLKITALQSGTAGDLLSVEVVEGGHSLVELDGTKISFASDSGLDGHTSNLAIEFISAFNSNIDITSIARVELLDSAEPETGLAFVAEENLSGGYDGHVLVSTGFQIDYAVARASRPADPEIATAASVIVTASGALTSGKTITVNNRTYTFVTALSADPIVPNEILIGVDEDASMANLTAAINGSAGEGTAYSVLTYQPTDVTAVFSTESDTIVTLTASTKGEDGNAYPVSSDDTNITVPEGGFTGGVDGTVAVAGAIRVEDNKIWAATTDTTITDSSGWKSASLT